MCFSLYCVCCMSVYVRCVRQLLVNSVYLQKAWMAVIKMAGYYRRHSDGL